MSDSQKEQLIASLGELSELTELTLTDMAINPRNSYLLMPLSKCSKLHSIKFERLVSHTIEPYCNLMKSIGH